MANLDDGWPGEVNTEEVRSSRLEIQDHGGAGHGVVK